MELLETISYDNADHASKATEAREASVIWEDDGYTVEVRDVADILKAGTSEAYQDGGRFEIWGQLQ